MKSSIVAAILGMIGASAAVDAASAREVVRIGRDGATVSVSRTHRHVYRVSIPAVVSADGIVIYGGGRTVVVPGYAGGYYSGYGTLYAW
jgi:hypothetical protein